MNLKMRFIHFGRASWRSLCLAVYLIVSLHSAAALAAPVLNDFSSDGCSMSPDGYAWDMNRILDCCVAHDLAYWAGGSRAERLAADEALRTCVESKTNTAVATVYFYSVREGGSPTYNTSFRWGYGWSEDNGYKTLTIEQKAEVQKKKSNIKWPEIYESIFLSDM